MYHSHNGGVDRKGAKLTLIVVVVHDMRGCSSGSNIQLSSANALTLLLLLSRTASKRAEFDPTKSANNIHTTSANAIQLTVWLISHGAVADLVMANGLCQALLFS